MYYGALRVKLIHSLFYSYWFHMSIVYSLVSCRRNLSLHAGSIYLFTPDSICGGGSSRDYLLAVSSSRLCQTGSCLVELICMRDKKTTTGNESRTMTKKWSWIPRRDMASNEPRRHVQKIRLTGTRSWSEKPTFYHNESKTWLPCLNSLYSFILKWNRTFHALLDVCFVCGKIERFYWVLLVCCSLAVGLPSWEVI